MSTSIGFQEGSTPRARGVDYVIDIVSMSKTFQRRTRAKAGGYTTVKSAFLQLLKGIVTGFGAFSRRAQGGFSKETAVTHAIKDLTLRIPKGASVGLIGRNGSGKSTFLKLVTGIYKPDFGAIKVNGRVSALIELGAGFHPDFTGRENLFLAGVMHGLTKEEIEARFDDIVSFAELEHVIDDPVRTYSSGMFMRLGFSIAIHTDPDVLLVDEVLAVGDAGFVAKCKERIAELRKEGKTLVLVTHDLDAVERWCDEVIWLHAGEVKERGYPRRVIDAYRQFIEKGEEEAIFAEEETHGSDSEAPAQVSVIDSSAGGEDPSAQPKTLQPKRWGSREVEIVSIDMLDQQGNTKRVFHTDDALTIAVTYRLNAPGVSDVVFGIGINRGDGLAVCGTNTHIERLTLPPLGLEGRIQIEISRIGLLDGSFAIDIAAHRVDGYPFDYHKDALHFTVRSPVGRVGVCIPKMEWSINGARCTAENDKGLPKAAQSA